MKIDIVDYGLGNLRSARRGLERAGASVSVTEEPEEIENADAVVLPGVGAFREGMKGSSEFHEPLIEAANEGKPLLGICLGMQMLMTESEEGSESGAVEGLDLVSGRVKRFPSDVGKIPHMGWNSLEIDSDHPIVGGIKDEDYVYFVHSYYTDAGERTVASTDYGIEFSAIVSNEKRNVVGTQFHPEKSGETGLRILKNFVEFAENY